MEDIKNIDCFVMAIAIGVSQSQAYRIKERLLEGKTVANKKVYKYLHHELGIDLNKLLAH